MTTVAALTFEQTALLLAWVAIGLLAFAMSGLMRLVHRLSHPRQGRAPGRTAPVAGTRAPAIPGLPAASRSLLLFVDPTCIVCDRVLEQLAAKAGNGTAGFAYAVLYRGEATDTSLPPSASITAIPNAAQVFADLDVKVTPTVVALDEHRTVIASAAVGSAALVEQFLAEITRGLEAPR